VQLKTLQDAFSFFSDKQNCIDYVVSWRWPDGRVTCPTCGSTDVKWLKSRSVFCCKTRHPKWQFSVKVGTIMEDSPIPLRDWLMIAWMLGSCRNGISSYEVARTIGVTQKSAWFMLHRLRKAMDSNTEQLSGEVEMDESYIGGRLKNQHVRKRKQGYQKDKTPVFGMVERGGRVVTKVVESTHSRVIQPLVEASVSKTALVISDNYPIYDQLTRMGYTHEVINHTADRFVRGNVHTNTIENFWNCLKRMLSGTYISVRPKHLQAYCQEQSFRFNCRKGFTEEQRLRVVLDGFTGKRLTYAELIGKA
jgi:transposase-like protein